MRRVNVAPRQVRCLAAILFVLILAPWSSATAQPASLRGEVLLPQGLRVAGASVILTLEAGGIRETTSDETGVFSFDGVPPGSHTVTVVRVGSTPRTINVEMGSTPIEISVVLDVAFAEDLTVTAQLQERSLQETVDSVAILTGTDLDFGTDAKLANVLYRTANAANGLGGLGLSIRGTESRGSGGAGSGLVIDVNVDGASPVTYHGNYTGALSIWDLEQIEILRGPQSTQRGRNALAGAISIRSRDPIFEPEFKARADYGSFDENRFAVAANVPLVDDKLAFRVSAERFGTDGFIFNPTRNEDDYSRRALNTVRAKLRWLPAENVDLVVAHTYSYNLLGIANILAADYPEAVRYNNDESIEESANNSTNIRLSYAVNPIWSLESETTYTISDYRTFQDADNGPEANGNGERTIDDTNFTQELRAVFRAERLSGSVGAYYADQTSDLDFLALVPGNLIGIPLPGVSASLSNGVDATIRNAAVFGEVDVELSPRWTVTVGARYDDETRAETQFNAFTVTPPIIQFPPRPPTDLDADFSAFLPKAGFMYHVTDDVSTGFTVQRGYRSGGAGLNALESYNFDAEYTTNYEGAFRSMWLGRRLVVNANAFYTDWTDQQVFVPGPTGLFDGTVENAGKSELYGFEVESEAFVNSRLELFANLGHTNSKYVEFLLDGEDLAGNRFPWAPDWTGAVGGRYSFLNGLFADLVGTFTGGSFDSPSNLAEEFSDSFFLVNLQAGYQADRWTLTVFARNLFDTTYLERRRNDLLGTAILGEPRVVGVSISTSF